MKSFDTSFRFLFTTLLVVTLLCGSTAAQSLEGLSAQLKAKRVEDRRAALHKLREIGTPEAGMAALPALADRDAAVRATAASVVILMRSAEVVAALARNLDDKDAFVRKETAYALGRTEGAAVAPMTGRLRTENEPEVKTALAVALGDLGNPAGIPVLVDLLVDSPKEETGFLRRSAARSIGRIAQATRTGRRDETSPVSFLPEKFKDDLSKTLPADPAYFRKAGEILLKVVGNDAESDDTRREAAYALGAIGDPAYRVALEALVGSQDNYLAEIAREALKRLSSVVR